MTCRESAFTSEGGKGGGGDALLSVMLYPRPYSDLRASGDPTHNSRPCKHTHTHTHKYKVINIFAEHYLRWFEVVKKTRWNIVCVCVCVCVCARETNSTLCITATRSASVSASSKWGVVNKIVRPLRLLLITSHMTERAAGSMPDVGSSSTTSLEWPTNATARHRRRRSPSDNWCDRKYRCSRRFMLPNTLCVIKG